MIEVLKQAYQLLLTEPHAPTVCDQLEVIFRRAIAELESQEPVCPDCKAKVLYECVACSSNNYPPQLEQNFCPRCGKRTNDIHTCTPPQEKNDVAQETNS
jgi:DNA-directed RNA polymerase subunit RPC12/RpoP